MKPLSVLLSLLLLPLAAPTLRAQFEPEQDKANAAAVSRLLQFAGAAKSNKVMPRAKEAYDRILSWYDPEHKQARAGLGQRKVGDAWQDPVKPIDWTDKANDDQRYRCVTEWNKAAQDLAKIHRTFGLKWLEQEPARAVLHLRRAVAYDPFDGESHKALGHEELVLGEGRGGTFYGTAEEIAFVQRLREIEKFALTLAKKEYEVEPVSEIPEELAKLKLEFHGAKSKTFTIFTRGTQENANDLVKWAERALEFLEWTLGEKDTKRLQARAGQERAFAWRGFIWTMTEKKDFIKENPQLFKDERDYLEANSFANISWQVPGGKTAIVAQKLTPAMMQDNLIGTIWNQCLGGNAALREGAMHAACWFLKSTTMTRYGALPEGTAGSAEIALPDSTNWWMREMRDAATAGTDWHINLIPRVQLSKFHNEARLKTWSFMVWCMARYPDKWLEFIRACPSDKIPFPEEIDQIGEKVFGKPLAEVDAEWREWASGRSGTASVTGYGPPLLPERPNKEQVDGMKRLNAIRKIANLPFVDLDAEATIACQEHARFLAMHPEHHKWPEAHEQDPAKEGFTPRGMRAGLRSVIVINAREAEESVDNWIGTVYHRFPLLEHNIRRIGFAFEDNMCVLDMGSLEEPRLPEDELKYGLIPFPCDRMTEVPLGFSAIEHPNPLEDVGLGFDDQFKTGYPVSLQFSRNFQAQLAEASLTVYELGKGKLKSDSQTPPAIDADINKEKLPYYAAVADDILAAQSSSVPSWDHTITTPLLKRMELKDVTFCIPKENLKPRTRYGAVATLNLGGQTRKVGWTFTTGTRRDGLGRL